MTNQEIKEFREKLRSLMEELLDFNKVAEALQMTPLELQRILNRYQIGTYRYCPAAHVLAKMYAENMPIHVIRKKLHISIQDIVWALQQEIGYKTFAERYGKTKYGDLSKQAAFCKERDRMIADYYKRGWDIPDLEMEFGLPEYFLKEILQEAGFQFEAPFNMFPRKPSLWIEKRNINIYDSYKKGIPAEELASRHELSKNTIEHIIYRKEIEMSPELIKRRPSKIKFRKKF